jgi:hypothetical protein
MTPHPTRANSGYVRMSAAARCPCRCDSAARLLVSGEEIPPLGCPGAAPQQVEQKIGEEYSLGRRRDR